MLIIRNETVTLNGKVKLILRNRAKEIVALITVDEEDLPRVQRLKWCYNAQRGVAVHSKSGKRTIALHQFILGSKKGYRIKHVNKNTHDNRKSNLKHVKIGETL